MGGPLGIAAERQNGVPGFAAQGIDVGSTGLEIGFGRAEQGAIAAMTRLTGSQPQRGATPCPAVTSARWPDGAVLYFESGTFVGWSKDGETAGRVCG